MACSASVKPVLEVEFFLAQLKQQQVREEGGMCLQEEQQREPRRAEREDSPRPVPVHERSHGWGDQAGHEVREGQRERGLRAGEAQVPLHRPQEHLERVDGAVRDRDGERGGPGDRPAVIRARGTPGVP